MQKQHLIPTVGRKDRPYALPSRLEIRPSAARGPQCRTTKHTAAPPRPEAPGRSARPEVANRKREPRAQAGREDRGLRDAA